MFFHAEGSPDYLFNFVLTLAIPSVPYALSFHPVLLTLPLSSCSSSFCFSGTAWQSRSWIINTHNILNRCSIGVLAVSTYPDYPSISRDPKRAEEVYAINILWKEEKFPSEALNNSRVLQLTTGPFQPLWHFENSQSFPACPGFTSKRKA